MSHRKASLIQMWEIIAPKYVYNPFFFLPFQSFGLVLMNGTKVDSLWRFRDPEPGRWLQLFCSQHIFEDRNVWYSCFHVCVFKGKMGGGGWSGSFWRKEHFRSNTRKNLLKLRAISLMIWEFLSLPKSDHDFFFFHSSVAREKLSFSRTNSGQSFGLSVLLLCFQKFIQ